ncbi:MAG: hypothetical protein QOE22_420 [Candidatus Parcubacteria bacterium]|jgi:hypothetical protein|nr:hypothetical protein [Candidatus Parcubacteria bacterium]
MGKAEVPFPGLLPFFSVPEPYFLLAMMSCATFDGTIS